MGRQASVTSSTEVDFLTEAFLDNPMPENAYESWPESPPPRQWSMTPIRSPIRDPLPTSPAAEPVRGSSEMRDLSFVVAQALSASATAANSPSE